MKAVILAGGMGTRISEETHLRPKPMIEIGHMPILWHIMKIYSYYGVNDFIICCGYKGNMVKEFFSNYFLYTSDVTFDMNENKMHVHHSKSEPWKVTVVDTGDSTLTGGRLKRVEPYLGQEDFCFTYGDGLTDANIRNVINFHKENEKLATVLAVQPQGRYGALELNDHKVTRFQEKPAGDSSWVNGGFFVLNPRVLKFIDNDQCIWEQGPLEKLSNDGQLCAFKHNGFWQAMDTLRDKTLLESLWQNNRAPWKVW
ncbi:MAG: glucose-1-phosphate cytidylyltransferase [bacterium]